MTSLRPIRVLFEMLREQYLPIVLAELSSGRCLPSRDRLAALGRQDLLWPIRQCGNFRRVHAELGITTDPHVILSVIRHLCTGDVLPTKRELKDAGFGNIVLIIERHFDDIGYFAASLGLRTFQNERDARTARRTLTIQRLLARLTYRLGHLPNRTDLTPDIRRFADNHGGIRRLVRQYLGSRCPSRRRALLIAALARRKAKSRHGVMTIPRLAEELRPYIERYLGSRGEFRIGSQLRKDRRFDIIRAAKRRSGVTALLRKPRFLPPELQRRLRLMRIRRGLWTFDAQLCLRGVMPNMKLIERERPKLGRLIRAYGGGEAVAKDLHLRTQRGMKNFIAYRRLLRQMGEIIVRHHRIPTETELPMRAFQVIRKRPDGVQGFLLRTARDPELRTEILAINERLKRLIGCNGHDPIAAEQLLETNNQLALIANRHERTP